MRDVAAALRDALRARANPGGGWGYLPGKRSRVEPTAWALLALEGGSASSAAWSPLPHLGFLQAAQTPAGALTDGTDQSPNYAFGALAALAVSRAGTDPMEPWLRRLLESIVGGFGVALPASANYAQDNGLRAWPWVDGSFSWVEPTAWCLLALKRMRSNVADPRIDRRIAEGDRLLVDRCCTPGGWNYGNANVLGQRLEPYVPTTAIALLALQDRRDHPAVERSIRYLQAHARDEQSGMALALSRICLGVFGLPAGEIEHDLANQYTCTRFLDNQHVTAMALYALAHAPTGYEAFRV